MIDLAILKERGCDAESIKPGFEREKMSRELSLNDDNKSKRAFLMDRIRSRISASRDFNMGHYSLYYALDLAYDAPFNQISPTLLASLADKSADDSTVMNSLKDWGIDTTEILQEVADPKTPGKNIRKVSVPAFFRIYVPLVASYIKIRWAKIVNDRRLVPFLKYEPAVSNSFSRMRCETITHRVEVMARQYGYFDVQKQAIFRMLQYAECFQFPVEEWHTECQEISKDSSIEGDPVKDKKGKVISKKVVAKEGLRYHLPHPTRTYYDRAWFPSTLNSDTGCTYVGYWRVMKWGEVRRNKNFYNLDSVGYGQTADLITGNSSFFANVYGGCTLQFPTLVNNQQGVSRFDSEKLIGNDFYNNTLDDKAVVITEHFEKLIPKDFGLGDYEYPVWFRFVVAGDDCVIYAAPLPYTPAVYYGYDAAEGRTHVASMSLEVMPFQDQFTNLLTQYLLTVRQNLTNLTMIDTDIVDEKDIKKLENWGERFWRSLNFIRFSGKKRDRIKNSGAMIPVVDPQKFPLQDTSGLINAMKVILDTLERVLVMSSQEVGQAATHEQTAEEVKNVASNTSTRVVFTGIAVDVARDAWKKQIYNGLMAYGQDEFYAQVPMEEPITPEDLQKLGFSYATEDPYKSYDMRDKKALIKANKTAIAYESFASDRDGDDRTDDPLLAKSMIEFWTALVTNPLVAPQIGPEQAIKAANFIAKMAGFPRDFKFIPLQNPQQDQNTQLMQQMGQYIDQVKQQIEGDVKNALSSVIDENKNQESEIQQLQQQLKQIAQIGQQVQAPPLQQDNFPPPMGG